MHGVTKGRIRLTLAPGEHHAGLTVNEYETLLMRHDLREVLRDPLRFMAEKAGHMLGNPRAIPAKTLDYAKYDLVRVFNKLVDSLGLRESMVESVLSRAIGDAGGALPADEALGEPAGLGPRRPPARARSSKAPTRARSWCSGTGAPAQSACSTSRSPGSSKRNHFTTCPTVEGVVRASPHPLPAARTSHPRSAR